jgi:subtilisin family serine protease
VATTPDLLIHVTTFRHLPVAQARVTVLDGRDVVASATTDGRGRAHIERPEARDVVVRVEAEGLAPDERVVGTDHPKGPEMFVLGRPGMPYYYRGTVRVPFEPIDDAVGVLLREPTTDVAAALRSRSHGETRSLADRVAGEVGATVRRSGGHLARSSIAVLAAEADATPAGPRALLERLSGRDDVEMSGALVRLDDDNVSFLTEQVLARFADGVDDTAVATIAVRHGFSHVGVFVPLAGVHRLRFDGPASYAVLDAANSLAAEPEVVWAEPDLVHTVEDDAVTPTDFLFPAQWDHSIIRTPQAWQVTGEIDGGQTFGDPDIIIAVVDSGVDLTHPDFSGTVSNGQPKAYQRFDFVTMTATMNTLDGDHGTCCASASTAQAQNPSTAAGQNEGVAGVAGGCRLIAVRRGGSEARYAETYLWLAGFDPNSPTPGFPAPINPCADVITNSFGLSVGSPISGLMSATFDRLTDDGRDGKGTLLFFSAGNINQDLDLTFHRPWSMYDRCFCIAASTLADDGVTEIKASYSSFGSTVDVCAPSNDFEGTHNPPTAYGAHTATILSSPEGDALPGHPDNRTTLTASSAEGATVLTVASTAGLTVGRAVLVGAPGTAGSEGRKITAVQGVQNRIVVSPALHQAHGTGTAVLAGPFSHRSDFGGTSYATPVCAGTAALMLSANPMLTRRQVLDILRDTAVKIDPGNTDTTGRWRDSAGRISTDPGYTGPLFSEFYGFGRVDTAAAVQRAREYGAVFQGQVHLRISPDLTGDGRADIVGFGDAGVWASRSNGNGTFAARTRVVDDFAYVAGGWRVDKHPRCLADLTRDGRADIVGFGDAGVWVALNNGNGTFAAPQLVLNNFAYVAGGWRVEKHPRYLADLTGDGRADIVGFGDAGVWASLNNGNGTFAARQLVLNNFAYVAGGWRVEKHPRYLAGSN